MFPDSDLTNVHNLLYVGECIKLQVELYICFYISCFNSQASLYTHIHKCTHLKAGLGPKAQATREEQSIALFAQSI